MMKPMHEAPQDRLILIWGVVRGDLGDSPNDPPPEPRWALARWESYYPRWEVEPYCYYQMWVPEPLGWVNAPETPTT